jgi:hypothetical protein
MAGGEIAYWLELKSFFEAVKLLSHATSVKFSAISHRKQAKKKTNKLVTDLFSKQMDLVNKQTAQLSDFFNRYVSKLKN